MKSVVFCASQRFKDDMEAFIADLRAHAEKRGVHLSVFEPNFDELTDNLHLRSEQERMRDPMYRETIAGKVYDHLFRKVRVADVCYVFNKNGYLGANTNGELFAAAALGKTIYAFDGRTSMGGYPDDLYEEPSSRKLIHEIVSTPEELLKRLL